MYIARKIMLQRLNLEEPCELTNKELCKLANSKVDVLAYVWNEKYNTIHENVFVHNKIDLKAFADKKRGSKVPPKVCPACKEPREHKLFLKVDRSICKYCLDCRRKGVK